VVVACLVLACTTGVGASWSLSAPLDANIDHVREKVEENIHKDIDNLPFGMTTRVNNIINRWQDTKRGYRGTTGTTTPPATTPAATTPGATTPPATTPAATTPAPTATPTETPGLAVLGSGPELSIVSCNPSSVTIQGSRSAEILEGMYFVSLPEGDPSSCASCAPLYRKVTSVTALQNGTKILATTFATAGDIAGDLVADSFKNELIEPLWGCANSGGTKKAAGGLKAKASTKKEAVHNDVGKASPQLATPKYTMGDCKPYWLAKIPDGRCAHTNCFVGKNGNPEDCFECKAACDNGCGSANGPIVFDGNFAFFDFGASCCNHDHCWTSNSFSKATCDLQFYDSMTSECTTAFQIGDDLPLIVQVLLFPLLQRVSTAAYLDCQILAHLFFGLLWSPLGSPGYTTAQAKPKEYEQTSVCIANPLEINLTWDTDTPEDVLSILQVVPPCGTENSLFNPAACGGVLEMVGEYPEFGPQTVFWDSAAASGTYLICAFGSKGTKPIQLPYTLVVVQQGVEVLRQTGSFTDGGSLYPDPIPCSASSPGFLATYIEPEPEP